MRLFEITWLFLFHTHHRWRGGHGTRVEGRTGKRWKMMTFDKTAGWERERVNELPTKKRVSGRLFLNCSVFWADLKNNNNMRWREWNPLFFPPDYDKETVRFFSCWSCITIRRGPLPNNSQLQFTGATGGGLCEVLW